MQQDGPSAAVPEPASDETTLFWRILAILAIIGVIALVTAGFIWGLLSLTIGRHQSPVVPTNQPAPLRPDSDQP